MKRDPVDRRMAAWREGRAEGAAFVCDMVLAELFVQSVDVVGEAARRDVAVRATLTSIASQGLLASSDDVHAVRELIELEYDRVGITL